MIPANLFSCFCAHVLPRVQTIEFPDDELVEPLEGLDIAEDGIELPPPPPPEPEKEIVPMKPNLLVSRWCTATCVGYTATATHTVVCLPLTVLVLLVLLGTELSFWCSAVCYYFLVRVLVILLFALAFVWCLSVER